MKGASGSLKEENVSRRQSSISNAAEKSRERWTER